MDDDNDVDIDDLDYFCDDWLWQLGMSRGMDGSMAGDGGMGNNVGFTESLSTPAPPCGELAETTQQQTELQSEPQPEAQIELEPLQPEPQPQFTEEDIQDIVDWLEQLWLTDEEVRKTSTEAEWLEFIEILKQTPLE